MNTFPRLLLALLPLSGLACSPPVPSSPADLTRVVALGRLEPAAGLLNVSGPPGDRVESLDGELEKSYSQAGEEMGRLASWSDRNLEYEIARAQRAEALRRKELIRKQGESQVAEAAERLRLLRQQKDPDLAAQQSLINAISKRRDSADAALKDMMASGMARTTLEQQRAVVHGLEAELAGANLRYLQTQQTYDLNIALAEKAQQTAQATLERLLAEVPEESLEKSEQAAKERRRHALILSPGPGRILQVQTHPGESIGPAPILVFGDTNQMVAVAEVYETDVNRIALGDRATIEFQDVPPGGISAGQVELSGTVKQIGRLVRRGTALDLNPAANADRRVIDVHIELDDKSSATAGQYVNRQVRIIIQSGKP